MFAKVGRVALGTRLFNQIVVTRIKASVNVSDFRCSTDEC